MSMICFHDPDTEYGYLSNWYLCDFTIGGVNFSSSEQYMMYRKAMLFKDNFIAKEILQTNDVDKIQKLGRRILGFDQETWDKNKVQIMIEGLLEKFSQNSKLGQKLLDTGDKILVECAGTDPVWACGISIYDKDHLDITKWQGQNLLGYVLMLVRDALK